MKIGYARFGLTLEVNVKNGSISTLGTELREGILHDFIDAKHEVYLMTELKKEDIQSVTKIGLFGRTWYNELKYTPLETIDLDLLIVECGPDNTLYGGQLGCYVGQALQVMSQVKCPVVYYQHGHLPFPYQRFLNNTGLENLAENNIRKIFFKYFNNINDLLQKMTIVHHFQNEQAFIEEFNYTPIKDKVKFKFIPYGWSKFDITYKPQEVPKYDLIWIGGENDSNKIGGSKENSRISLVKEFFEGVPYKSIVVGRWSEETTSNVKATFMGPFGKHGDAYRLFNDSYCTLWGGSISTCRTGLIPSRPVMALLSGSIVLAMNTMYKIDSLIDKQFLVSNNAEANVIIRKIKNMDILEREMYCKKQLNNFPQWRNIKWY